MGDIQNISENIKFGKLYYGMLTNWHTFQWHLILLGPSQQIFTSKFMPVCQPEILFHSLLDALPDRLCASKDYHTIVYTLNTLYTL